MSIDNRCKEIIIEPCNCVCNLKRFIIKGINADIDDFGEQYDCEEENMEDHGCGNMIFKPKKYSDEILNKYSISIDEYNKICEKLKMCLSFGKCNLCT